MAADIKNQRKLDKSRRGRSTARQSRSTARNDRISFSCQARQTTSLLRADRKAETQIALKVWQTPTIASRSQFLEARGIQGRHIGQRDGPSGRTTRADRRPERRRGYPKATEAAERERREPREAGHRSDSALSKGGGGRTRILRSRELMSISYLFL